MSRKPDFTDWALQFDKRLQSERKKVYQYPPGVQDILGLFWDIFKIPIPEKSNPTRFERWIKELAFLDKQLLGYTKEQKKEMLTACRETAKTLGTNIVYPASINSFLQGEMGRMNLRIEKEIAKIKKEQKDENVPDGQGTDVKKFRKIVEGILDND